jgi:cell division protein FtsI/penicillin-binding protein 2
VSYPFPTAEELAVRTAGRSAAALLAALAVTASGCSVFRDAPEPDPAARAFLDAWARGDVAAAGNATDDAASAQATLQEVKEALAPTRAEMTLGAVSTEGDQATAAYSAAWSLPGVADPWRYAGRLALVRQDSAWKVRWQPADVHPQLGPGQKLAVIRALPERAPLLDAAGTPLFGKVEVVTVGIERARVRDLPGLAATLARVLKISAADIVTDVRKAKPTAFVPVITLRMPDYRAVKAQIHELPGTVFRTETRLLAPTKQFAQPLLGKVAEATAEVLNEAGPGYRTGDQLGLSGLQRALNSRLTGTAGAQIRLLNAAGGTVATLGTLPGKPGTPVRTTLERRVQAAADAAAAGTPTPAAIVAVRPSTGELLAVANNDKAAGDIALTGHYPAGSTFKTITATALLAAGVVQETSTVACPGTVTVGKVFQNEDRFDLGRVPLRTAFARSCNTTFTALSQRLDDRALPDTAAAYGIGTQWTLPVPSFGGSVPAPADDTEKAADAIGQGKVEVSPLAMALVAAAVAKGGRVTPSLLAGTPAAPAGGATPSGPPAAALPALRDMMRAVVTEGTATPLATLPGGPVAGKTGTAEHGTATPPQAHAWFIGYRGDLAFAVFVQDGQSSKRTAVPVARAFLAALR